MSSATMRARREGLEETYAWASKMPPMTVTDLDIHAIFPRVIWGDRGRVRRVDVAVDGLTLMVSRGEAMVAPQQYYAINRSRRTAKSAKSAKSDG